MAKVTLTPAAREDLRQIRRYIALDNPQRARSFIEEIREHSRRLASYPQFHAVDMRIDTRTRKANHGLYLIFYETADDGILVLRILHGSRDLTPLLLRSK